MTFNDDSDISDNRVRRRGRGAAIGAGGGILGVVVIALVSQFLGVDVSGLLGGGGGGSGAPEEQSLAECTTGADATNDVDCRMASAQLSLDAFWATAAPDLGLTYSEPDIVLFDQSTNTGCGSATSATGPFYCPPDATVYIDTSFYAELRDRFGATGGTLSELYVVAHEWGHHIQNEAGSFASTDRSDTGPGSDTIRLEVQADCYAGAWVAGASTTADASGETYLEPVTDQQIANALSAASAVGDDRIQQSSGGGVNPETWTHGSSDQRQRWFTTGYSGGVTACDTFAVGVDQL